MLKPNERQIESISKATEKFINTYLEYYRMTKSEFDEVLDKWTNKNLFRKENGKWKPLFTIK